MYALFFTCIATTAESTPAFHPSSFQPAPYDSNQTNIHHITRPFFFSLTLYFCISDWCFILGRTRAWKMQSNMFRRFQFSYRLGDSIQCHSLTHSLTHSLLSFCEIVCGVQGTKKTANKLDKIIANTTYAIFFFSPPALPVAAAAWLDTFAFSLLILGIRYHIMPYIFLPKLTNEAYLSVGLFCSVLFSFPYK